MRDKPSPLHILLRYFSPLRNPCPLHSPLSSDDGRFLATSPGVVRQFETLKEEGPLGPLVQPNTALAWAVAAGLLAVGIVTADLAYNLTARLQFRTTNGEWRTAAEQPYPEERRGEPYPVDGSRCATRFLRLLVDNDKPLAETVRVLITYRSLRDAATYTVLDERWSLGAQEERTFEFEIPETAFGDSTVPSEVPVTARVDDLYLWTCVEKGV